MYLRWKACCPIQALWDLHEVVQNNAVYRYYFLSDFKHEYYYRHCLTPDNVWHHNTTCFTLDAKS